jgi:hypothetical protein
MTQIAILRDAELIPGTPENMAALDRLLQGWRCCGCPDLCGAPCRDDELSDTLARAARLVATHGGEVAS